MKITETNHDEVTIINLDGRFDANTCSEVESFIRERLENGKPNFILNMEKVGFIASAGLRVILVVAKELRQGKKGDLRIAMLQPSVRKVFEISGLNNVLQIFDNDRNAISSFQE